MARITVVTGPPCAGKTTHVADNRARGDIVVDLDALTVALGSTQSHDAVPEIRKAALAARTAVINHVMSHTGAWSWIIHSAPNASQMRQYQSVGAAVVTVDPGMDACLQRAESDGRPVGTADVIRSWYADAAARSESSRSPQVTVDAHLAEFSRRLKAWPNPR